MIDARSIMREAVRGAPLSLKDDPTAWDGEPTRGDVLSALVATARDNAQSALAQAFGREAETIATAFDVAITEDGPLADLHAVWSEHVGPTQLQPHFGAVLMAEDWDGRVAATREAMAALIERMTCDGGPLETPAADMLDTMIASDPRLAHLAGGGEPVPEPETVVWDDEPEIEEGPPIGDPVTEVASGEAEPLYHRQAEAPAAVDWDDDDEPAAAPAKSTRGKRSGKSVPLICGLLDAAGFLDKDAAALLGVDKSYYSLMRSGKRPWQGLRDDVAAKLRVELAGRADAVAQALAALDTPEVRHQGGA